MTLVIGHHFSDGLDVGAVGNSSLAQASLQLGVFHAGVVVHHGMLHFDLAVFGEFESLSSGLAGFELEHSSFSFRMLPFENESFIGLGSDEHGHASPFEFGRLFHDGDILAFVGKNLQKLGTKIGMRHFTSAETNRHLDLVTISDEAESIFDLEIDIMVADAGRQPDLFCFNDLLILAVHLFAFGLLKAVFAEIHDAANRRCGGRRDHNEVKALFLGTFQRFIGRHDTELGTIRSDHANLSGLDLFIDLMTCSSDV